MEAIIRHQNNIIWYSEYPDKRLMDFPFEKPFVWMIWNNLEWFIDEKLIEHFINNDCKYFLVWWCNRDSWDMEADHIYVQWEMQGNKNDDNFVSTTSHEDINEMIFYWLHCTNDLIFKEEKNYLLIQVGNQYSKEEILKIIEQEY